MKKEVRSEVARQFDEIYTEHHNPQSREKRKILANRKKRGENNKKDLGL